MAYFVFGLMGFLFLNPTNAVEIAYYALDETSWGVVTDSSGNGFDGNIVGTVTPSSTTPAIATDPGSCGYAELPASSSAINNNAIDTSVDIDDDVGNEGTISFWYKSNVDWNDTTYGSRQLFDASTAAGKYFHLVLSPNARLQFELEESTDRDFDLQSTRRTFAANTWVHITVTWHMSSGTLAIYVNGVLDVSRSFRVNSTLGELNTLYIGDNRSTYIDSAMTVNSANGDIDEVRIDSSVLNAVDIQTHMNATHPCSPTSTTYFVITHDNFGINCLGESVRVTAKLPDGSTDTSYLGPITLDTQNSNGNWSNNGSLGTFIDTTADDGLASYTYSTGDNGEANFYLTYPSGPALLNIDAYYSTIRDDDSEGDITFNPNGFTVTASALTNPPPNPIDTVIPAQTSATALSLYLAAYGQTATDSDCGIIESYDGSKSLHFWSDYDNPSSGTLNVAVNSSPIASNEGSSAAQAITFTQGQAQINVNYSDVGAITLAMKDINTGDPALPTGIRGNSQSYVIRPAGFVLSNIQRSSDSFANPGTASDALGAIFMAAGDNFSTTVTAINSSGGTTPNYGQESPAEGITLTPTLVAPLGGDMPAIGFTTGFDGFVNGVDSGSDFYWDEVGIITLTPSVADSDYLGSGDVTGSSSVNIGRFYPNHFTTSITDGSFANNCLSAIPFTYLGDSFSYLINPTITTTATSARNSITDNYTASFAKLTTGGVTLSYPTADNSKLDENGLPIAVSTTMGSLSRVDNANGSLSFSLGGISNDNFSYDRSAGEITQFIPDLTIQLTALSDGEASANDLSPAKTLSPTGNNQRFGRAYTTDAYGTMSQIGDSLTVNIGIQYIDAIGNWVTNSDDSCSTFSYVLVDNGITTTGLPSSPATLASGINNLTLTLSADAGDIGGSTLVTTSWDDWLLYDEDDTDQASDGNFYDDPPSATATFGVFIGDVRHIYWLESP